LIIQSDTLRWKGAKL